jgi:hypothetical protein
MSKTVIGIETLLDACNEVGPKENAKKTKNMLICCY